MGFDLAGFEPRNETGEWFRNNGGYWHKLWDLTRHLLMSTDHGLMAKQWEAGHYNNSVVVDKKRARLFYHRLIEDLNNGTVQATIDWVYETFPGAGKDFFMTKENVSEFAQFCRYSGGFKIY